MITKEIGQQILFCTVWIFRWLLGGISRDASLIVTISLAFYSSSIYNHIPSILGTLHNLPEASTITIISCLLSIGFLTRRSRGASSKRPDRVSNSVPNGSLKPAILPCRTAHTRIFPKKHDFAYSYLQVGVPVGWKGSVSSILSVDEEYHQLGGSSAWFKVEAADHLQRGNDHLGLDGKLKEYLKSQVCSSANKAFGIISML